MRYLFLVAVVLASSSGFAQTMRSYDSAGHPTLTAVRSGSTIRYYDAAGHLVERDEIRGNKVYEYDSAGHFLGTTDFK